MGLAMHKEGVTLLFERKVVNSYRSWGGIIFGVG